MAWRSSYDRFCVWFRIIILFHPDVIPAIMGMLSNPNISPHVFQYHLTLVKNLVIHSLAKTEDLTNIKMAGEARMHLGG